MRNVSAFVVDRVTFPLFSHRRIIAARVVNGKVLANQSEAAAPE
jgi:hypothetical protein